MIEKIKKALQKLGIDEKYAVRIQTLFKIEKEEEIDSAVKLFQDNVLPDLGVPKATLDKAVADSVAKAISEYETKYNLKDGVPVKTSTASDDDLPKGVKSLFEEQAKQIEALTGLVTGVVTTQKSVQQLAEVKEKLKGKVDDKFIETVANRVNLSAESIDEEIATHVKEFVAMKQLFINEAPK